MTVSLHSHPQLPQLAFLHPRHSITVSKQLDTVFHSYPSTQDQGKGKSCAIFCYNSAKHTANCVLTISISPSSRPGLGGTGCFPRWDQPSWFPQLLGRVWVSHSSHMSGQHLAYLSGEGNAEDTWESPSCPRVATQKSLHSQSRGG